MPSFVCDQCQETLKKQQLDKHRQQRCRIGTFSCIDCYRSFGGVSYREHTSCITEVQKYHQRAAPGAASESSSTSPTAPSAASLIVSSTKDTGPLEKDRRELNEDEVGQGRREQRRKERGTTRDVTAKKSTAAIIELLSETLSAYFGEDKERELGQVCRDVHRSLRRQLPGVSKRQVRRLLLGRLVVHSRHGKLKLTLGHE
jgi:hypothetical protein